MNIKYFGICIASLIYFYFLTFNVYAVKSKEIYFNEDFTENVDLNWNVYNAGGNVTSNFLGLTLSSPSSNNFPFLYTKNNIFPVTGNYEIDVEYSYPNSTDFGVGFGLGNDMPIYSQSSYSSQDELRNWLYFYVWQASNFNHTILGRNCQNNDICDSNITILSSGASSDNSIHSLKIKFISDHFEIFHNGVQISNTILLNSSRRPTNFWIGNPVRLQTINSWTTIRLTSLKVYKTTESLPEKNAVVVLPGFGGSWDVSAILKGEPGINWKIPPFVKEYDGIINSLKNAGYEEDKDFFVFPYDWRKNLNSLADDLKSFIEIKNLGDRKVDLVGHSLGGLVARTYLQKHNNPNTNKVVMAGSPNKGIIDAYGLWEGATVWDGVWWQNILLEIATEVNRHSGESKIEAVRRVAPSVKDLLPTENFLKENNIFKPLSGMAWKNDFLSLQNQNVIPFLSTLVSGGSDDYNSSRESINVVQPSKEDKIVGLWTDGKPKEISPFNYGSGDGFVTINSSTQLFNNKLDLSGGHGETISKLENIQKILGSINIATESAVGSNFDNRKSAFVAKLNSPGKLHVCYALICDSSLGLVFETEKMIIVPGFSNQKYTITVEANGETGNYELLVGKINETGVWKSVFNKLTSVTQTDKYFFDGETEQLSSSSDTAKSLIKYYWPKGIKLSDVYEIRLKILEEIDKNIKAKNIVSFDTNIDKWRTLDYFVASENATDKFFGHEDWEYGFKKVKKSKYIDLNNNYYSSTLVTLIQQNEKELKKLNLRQLKLKTDKFIQLLMLKQFVGI